MSMNVTWHIVKKDLRRMAPAGAVWIALVVAGGLLVRLTTVPEAGDVRAWWSAMRLLAGGLAGAGGLLAVLWVAQLVQEDAVLGTDAMWLTRPIGRGRMAGAKLLAAALMLIAAPVVVLVPVWLASGFSAGELAATVGDLAVGQGMLVVLAGSLAALTRDLGKFIFALVGLVLVTVLGTVLSSVRGGVAEVNDSRRLISELGGPLVVVAAGCMQYFTRRTRGAWSVLGGGLVVVVVASVLWPWGNLAGFSGVTGAWPRGREAAMAQPVMVLKIGGAAQAGAAKTAYIETTVGGAKDEFMLPWNGGVKLARENGPAIRGSIERDGRWGEVVVKRMLGLVPNTGPMTTAMALWQHAPADRAGFETGGALKGELRMARVKARVLGEWPWRAGVIVEAGSSETRVVSAEVSTSGFQGTMRVAERDARRGPLFMIWARGRGDESVRRDVFVLVNRRLGVFQPLRVSEGGAILAGGLQLAERTLVYEPAAGVAEDWARDAVVVKVRFDVLERWTKTLTGDRVVAFEVEK